MGTGVVGSTHPSACSGDSTACTVCSDEPSPMAAKAMRFCFRTVRTKPLRARVAPGEGRGELEGGWAAEALSRAAMLLGAKVELQRGRKANGAARRGDCSRRWKQGLGGSGGLVMMRPWVQGGVRGPSSSSWCRRQKSRRAERCRGGSLGHDAGGQTQVDRRRWTGAGVPRYTPRAARGPLW